MVSSLTQVEELTDMSPEKRPANHVKYKDLATQKLKQ